MTATIQSAARLSSCLSGCRRFACMPPLALVPPAHAGFDATEDTGIRL
ncbi:hypothetical protein [Methanoculleus chikugoensis]|nr:hypothetical protein [Methanoculleus chikugoensis]